MITIYYYNWCGFSLQALQYCKLHKLKFVKHNMTRYGGKTEVIKILKKHNFMSKSNNHNTAPIIFIDDKFIGGFEDLVNHYNF